ncbi:uncharacterized protein [Physcomitrium patens]|uniref:PHD-type domain-containing protein n=1 Tax=Physcomitrium patens TaxID=3218 RepID=A0A7I4FUE6_PHYPA|nr:uncharacterized protein LOC112286113 isoform X3 [Physcomitrium patens]|eukprot:XP_024383481.1 uncharacterized protein LOC112286113 isoform X3 [Physcomitrella patens]
MAFHTACLFTCRKICYCTLGTPAPLRAQSGQNEFLRRTAALQKLVSNPRLMLGGGPEYVEITVPPLPNQPKKNLEEPTIEQLDDSGDDGVTKRAGTRRKATFSIVGPADSSIKGSHSKKLEAAKYASRQHASREASANGWADRERAGMPVRGGSDEEFNEEGHFESLFPQVVCGLCGCGEAIGSDKAGRMLSCQACRKQYHRKCTKYWAEHRDLFNWASWMCGSCRVCEVCLRSGDSNKLMFCKRCDHAYHSSCLHPPLKHVPKGPFVCPKHVRCTSCNTTVPGGGVSSKWFLSYSLCDACGRLFTRGKYCPICLKVYRDSEPAPMVCCDVCEHWVHCECDGISDEKYQEFQVNSQLRYKCASCRGECYKVADLDDAAVEIWRRKDIRDATQIAEIRAAAGLPSPEEILKAYPSSDEEDRERDSSEVEEASKRSAKKKVKKAPLGTESLTKNNKTPKRAAIKDGSKPKSTPSKVDGVSDKPILTLSAVDSKKTTILTKKFKKGSTSGDGLEKTLPNKDLVSTLSAEDKDADEMKKMVPPPDVHIGLESLKDKKRKSDSSKEKSSSTKRRRSSKAGDLDSAKNLTIQDDSGKAKKVKISNGQEVAGREDKSEVPTTSTEIPLAQEGFHVFNGKSTRERASIKVARIEADLDSKLARIEASRLEPQLEVGATDNSEDAQESQPGQCSSPLHWVGHSDSVRRRRIPSSKYRDMDTSAWRHGRMNKDLSSAQNPVPEIAQTSNKVQTSEDFQTVHQEKSRDVEDNIDNDDLSEAPRKRLKVTDLPEKKSEGLLLHSSPGSDSPVTRRLRLKIKKQPAREVVIPTTSKDNKASEHDGELAIKAHQTSKKKRTATPQRNAEGSTQRRLAIGDATDDDSWILQRLGTDAISKRVEVFWPIDNIWYKGTIVAVFSTQFCVDYDDGDQETLEFGKEKVRLLSTTKKIAS